jgi:hypothetical protein
MDGEPRLSVSSITLENHRVACLTLGASGKTTDSIIGRKQADLTSPGVQGIAVDQRDSGARLESALVTTARSTAGVKVVHNAGELSVAKEHER